MTVRCGNYSGTPSPPFRRVRPASHTSIASFQSADRLLPRAAASLRSSWSRSAVQRLFVLRWPGRDGFEHGAEHVTASGKRERQARK